MFNFKKYSRDILTLWSNITIKRKQQLTLVVILSVISAFAEVVTIGLVLPFLALLTNPDVIYEFPFIESMVKSFGLEINHLSVVNVSIVFGFAALLSGLIRILMVYTTYRYSLLSGSELANVMFKKILYQNYKIHLKRNTSEVVDVVFSKISLINQNIIVSTLALISSFIIVLSILIFLSFIKPLITLGTLAVLAIGYYIIMKSTKNRIYRNSKLIARDTNLVVKTIQEGVSGIREILLSGLQNTYSSKLEKIESGLREAQSDNIFMSLSPRYIVEPLAIIIIIILAMTLNTQGYSGIEIALLGMLALTGQRLLPIINQSYYAYTCIRGEQGTLEVIVDLLNQHQKETSYSDEVLPFNTLISLKNVSFSYGKTAVLKNVNLDIHKGQKIGLIGKTASGKSTLADIIACLLEPDTGSISVDGVSIDENNFHSWQKNISYVSQSIFLNDSSFTENIAYGENIDEIDLERVYMSAKKSQLSESIDNLPDKYNTIIGEKGVKLSGGQKQRLALARALYKRSTLLILDEATSALDNETEKLVMNAIMGLSGDITMLIIAHRTTTLSECDTIIELKDGDIHDLGDYKKFLKYNYRS